MQYTSEYESALLRGVEDPRPWDLLAEIAQYVKTRDNLLDIGCGTAKKLIKLTQQLNESGRKVGIYGIDPNRSMRAKAKKNVEDSGLDNILILDGTHERIPFPDESFDVVTCMAAPHGTYDIWRVLKPGGYAVVEKISDRDKYNLKVEFGDDKIGPRGQLLELREGQRAKIYEEDFGRLFSKVEVRTGSWVTYYSIQGLIKIFEQTSTVRNFDAKKDDSILAEIARKYTTEKGIKTEQQRVLVHAVK